jgi:hypothetical protein
MTTTSGRASGTAALIAMLLSGSLTGCAGRAVVWAEPQTRVVETLPLRIDKLYPSMTGPSQRLDIDPTGMDWITAIRNEVIDSNGQPMGGEFFCHSQFQARERTRLAVAATGIDELRFPEGFGIHVSGLLDDIPEADRHFSYFGMLLNNHYPEMNQDASIRATVEYRTNEEVGSPPRLKRLYSDALVMTVEDLAGYTPEEAGESTAPEDQSTHCALVEGRPAHWMVPPGAQLTRSVFQGIVPVESTVHYALAHLHNEGEWVRLTDLTTDELLWQTDVEYERDRRQITRIRPYSSDEGFLVYPDHEYELEAYYDNSSGHEVDAMVVMYLYYHPTGDPDLLLLDNE